MATATDSGIYRGAATKPALEKPQAGRIILDDAYVLRTANVDLALLPRRRSPYGGMRDHIPRPCTTAYARFHAGRLRADPHARRGS